MSKFLITAAGGTKRVNPDARTPGQLRAALSTLDDIALQFSRETVTSSTSVTTGNITAVPGQLVRCNVTGGSITITLPSNAPLNTEIGVLLEVGSVPNIVTVDAGALSILARDGTSTATRRLFVDNDYLRFKKHGQTVWVVVTDGRMPHYCDLRSTLDDPGQTIEGAEETVLMDDAVSDNAGLEDNNEITIRRSGFYNLYGCLTLSNAVAGTGKIELLMQVENITIVSQMLDLVSSPMGISLATGRYLTAGENVRLRVSHTNGGNRNVSRDVPARLTAAEVL